MRRYLAIVIVLTGAAVCGMLMAQTRRDISPPPRGSGPESTVAIAITTSMSSTTAIPIVVRPGATFTITLASNHTTGYRWQLAAQPKSSVVRQLGSTYRENSSGMLGAGGVEVWSFKAAGQGKTNIVLQYLRSFEHGVPAVKAQTFSVSVQ